MQFDETREKILEELTSDHKEIIAAYLAHFEADLRRFAESMANSLLKWELLDSSISTNEKRAYISALVYTTVTLHVVSMKLLVSGHTVAAGNLLWQVVETLCVALVCSGKDTGILDKFMEHKYSTKNAVRDAKRHSEKLGLNRDAVEQLAKLQTFYSNYSHPTLLTIALGMSFQTKAAYFGGSFDEVKLDAYRKEVKVRVGLANDLPNLIDRVRKNIAEW